MRKTQILVASITAAFIILGGAVFTPKLPQDSKDVIKELVPDVLIEAHRYVKRSIMEAQLPSMEACVESVAFDFDTGTSPANANQENTALRYLFIGHGYGKPGTQNLSLAPKIKRYIRKNVHSYDQIFFVGDITRTGSKESWIDITNFFNSLEFNNYTVVAGNHDLNKDASLEKRKLFQEIFNPLDGYHLSNHGDLILWFELTSNGWSLNEAQKQFIKTVSQELEGKFRSLLVVTHQLAWAEGLHGKSEFSVNSLGHLSPTHNSQEFISNFNLNVPVIFISGDVGAGPPSMPLQCKTEKVRSFVASGVGENNNDYLHEVVLDKHTLFMRPIRLENLNGE